VNSFVHLTSHPHPLSREGPDDLTTYDRRRSDRNNPCPPNRNSLVIRLQFDFGIRKRLIFAKDMHGGLVSHRAVALVPYLFPSSRAHPDDPPWLVDLAFSVTVL
jgi:hypothetical protein